MTEIEKMAVQPMNEVIAKLLMQRNKGTEDCVTTSEYAREIGMHAPDLNSALIDLGILERKSGQLRLTLKYQERGYTMNRSCFKYTKRGQLVEIVYPVWTSKGVDFLRKKLNIKK